MRHCEKIIREPLDKAAEVVAKAVEASDAGGSAKGNIRPLQFLRDIRLVRCLFMNNMSWPVLFGIGPTKRKTGACLPPLMMMTRNEIMTKNVLMVLRKNMAIGSAPLRASLLTTLPDDSTSDETWHFVHPKTVIRTNPADTSVCPGTVAVPAHNSFDILSDSYDKGNVMSHDGDLPAAVTPVEGLHSSTEYSSPFI